MPFSAVAVTVKGKIAPCSVFAGSCSAYREPEDIVTAFNGSIFQNVRDQMLAGEIPEGCQNCYFNENRGITSKRMKYRRRRNADGKEIDLDRPSLRYLELAISNLCNLDCVTCSGEYSSKWRAKEIEFLKTLSFRDFSNIPTFSVDHRFLEFLKNLMSNLDIGLDLIGGEPLMSTETQSILQEVALVNPDLPVAITSNFTLVDDELSNVLAKLNQLTLCISVDGVDALYHYIRGVPYKRVEDNLQKLSMIQPRWIQFNPCISIYNVLDLPNIWERLNSFGEVLFHLIAIEPRYVGVRLLPMELREEAVLSLAELQSRPGISEDQIAQLDRTKSYLLNMYEEPTHILTHAQQWTHEMNQMRNTKIWEIEPRLKFLEQSV